MASLAGLLKDRGFQVQGSDANPYPPMSTQLEALQIPVFKGYRKENLHPKPDFVIVGNVISKSNDEAQELLSLGIPYTSLPKAMGEFIIADREAIVVSGTHGKTTTTSMMAWVMTAFENKVGFLVGGIPKNFAQSFQNPEGKYFVIEGDEYDTAFFDKVPKFVHYRPRHVILTSVEFDHADIYKDLDAVKESFARLMTMTPTDGTLLYSAEDKNVCELQNKCLARKKFGYGLKSGDYQGKVLAVTENGCEFEVFFRGELIGKYSMVLTGDYNVLNALAVIGLSHQLGLDLGKVKQKLQSFQGVKRRQEILGEPGGVLVIEDFAHHPTAVRETVLGIQKKYPGKKIFSVFEPRSATSRRKVFQKDYVEAFRACDDVLIAEAFDQGKIEAADRFSVQELVADLRAQGVQAEAFASADEIVKALALRAKAGNGILIMSNGGFDGIYGKLLAILENRNKH
jgi:UDP-N-acetylmuramate: L-alanyl-gamma-D-glutamyl-meso-diaminopimelate ligase